MTEPTNDEKKIEYTPFGEKIADDESYSENIKLNTRYHKEDNSFNSAEVQLKNYDVNIPLKIGKGDDAKNSVVWHVITYTLTIYSCIVAALLIIDIMLTGGKNCLTTVKDSWATFTPIITLSLGYMFGKKENEKEGNP